MILESRVIILDPYNRNLNIEYIIGNSQHHEKWTLNQEGILSLTIQRPWISLQGPDGILDKLNKIGMQNMRHEPFTICSQQQYWSQIAQTTCVLV